MRWRSLLLTLAAVMHGAHVWAQCFAVRTVQIAP